MPAWPPPFMICNSFTEVWLSGFISWGLSLQASSPCYTSFKGCFVQQDLAVVCLVRLGVPTASGAGVRGESGTGSITWVGLWFWGFDGSVVGMQVCASSCTRVQAVCPCPNACWGTLAVGNSRCWNAFSRVWQRLWTTWYMLLCSF